MSLVDSLHLLRFFKMLTKNQIKHLQSLNRKKYRFLHREFIVEGDKSVGELLKSSFEIVNIYALDKWINMNNELLKNRAKAVVVSEDELKKSGSYGSPNMVLAVVKIPEAKDVPPDIFSDIVIALDDIRDPGNLGMIIRTADWFGIKNIVCSNQSVDAYNPKVIQSTMGSFTRVAVYYTDLFSFLKNLPQGIRIYGSMLDGEYIHNKKLENGVIIIGNESNGISEELLPLIHERVAIPPFSGSGGAESLNAALANAVICYEFRRQKYNSG